MSLTTKSRTLTSLLRHLTTTRHLCTTPKPNPKLVNFSLPSDSDTEDPPQPTTKKTNLPPPYDPFNKNPLIQDATDPKNLQEVFHRIRTDGCFESAVKMFDGLSKEGLTCEALELFGEFKDKGCVPDVVAHTAVVEAYVDAGKPKDALKVFLRMLAAGVLPNAYTYGVLIKGLSADGKMLGEAKKYATEMMEKDMKPNAETTVSVLEGFVREGKADEGREFVAEMKKKGFLPDKNAVFLQMLQVGVLPNAYTYGVLIKGLSVDGEMLGEAKKYAMEMMEKGMKPNAETTVSVLEGFVREGKADEGREFVAEMKKRRFLPDKNAVREILRKTRGPESSSVMDIILDL